MKTKEAITDKIITWKEMLKVIPAYNIAAEINTKDNEHVVITVKKKKPKYLFFPLKWLLNPRLKSNIELDLIGSYIWHLCDEKKTVEEIIDIFSEKYKLTFHEARTSVAEYIKMLVQRGALGIIKFKE